MTPKKKVLFVCLGNICRSPLAEAVFRHKVKERGVDHLFEADSCGTSNYHIGDPPDARTLANAHRNGIQIQHVGRQLSEADLVYFDLVLAMDKNNHRAIMQLSTATEHQHKIKLMRSFDPHLTGDEVPDPYYGGEHGFQDVFDILDRSMDQLITQLMQQAR